MENSKNRARFILCMLGYVEVRRINSLLVRRASIPDNRITVNDARIDRYILWAQPVVLWVSSAQLFHVMAVLFHCACCVIML